MLVSTQQDCAEKQLDSVIESNLSGFGNELSSKDRLTNGIKTPNNNIKVSTFEDDFKPHQLTDDEKRYILNTTFKLGNLAVFDKTKEDKNENFVHSYTPRFIDLNNYIYKGHGKSNLFARTSGALSSTLVLK